MTDEVDSLTKATISRSLLGVVVALAGLPALLWTPLNHDVACALIYARRLMDGDVLYRDMVDNNPPLIIYASVPIEWLSMHLGLDESTVVAAAMIGLTLVCARVAATLMEHAEEVSSFHRWTILTGFVAAALWLPARDFGQREHIAFLLLFPYTLAQAQQPSGGSIRAHMPWLTASGLAGLAIAFKPQFAVFWLLLVGLASVRRNAWRAAVSAENLVIAAILVGYAGLVQLRYPTYTRDIVPLAVAHYGAYTSRFVTLAMMVLTPLLPPALLVMTSGADGMVGAGFTARVVRMMGACSAAFVVVFFLGGTDFRYHLLPALGFYLVGAVTVLGTTLRWMVTASRKQLEGQARRVLLVTLCAVPLGFIAAEVAPPHVEDIANRHRGIASPLVGSLQRVVADRARGKPLFVLSSSVPPAFPLVNLTGAQWPYRYNCLWLLPAHYRSDNSDAVAAYRLPDAQEPAERALFDTVVRELVAQPPAVLIVDRVRYKQGFGRIQFDFVDYFSQAPAFAALLERYDRIATVDQYDVYVLARPGASQDRRG